MNDVAPYPFDDDLPLATRADRVPRWRLYVPPGPMVVLGYGSRVDREIFADRCAGDEVPVYRRRGGGCAVVLDPGVLVAAAAIPVDGILGTKAHFNRLTDWLADGLARTGVAGIRKDGIFDLTCGGRKIAGGSTHRTHEVLFWTASVLVVPPVALMERYLRHPPREPAYRAHRDHGGFVTGVAAAGGPADAPALRDALRPALEPIGCWSPLPGQS